MKTRHLLLFAPTTVLVLLVLFVTATAGPADAAVHKPRTVHAPCPA